MTVARKTIRGRLTTLTEAQVQAGARVTLSAVEVLEGGTTRTLDRVADLTGHLLMIGEDTHYVTRDGDGSYSFSNVPVTNSAYTSPTDFALQLSTISGGELVEQIVFLLLDTDPDEQWVDQLVAMGDSPLTPTYPQLVNEAVEALAAIPGTITTTLTDDASAATVVIVGRINAAINALVNGAPGALNTLKEIADQLATDEGAASSVAAALATHAGRTDNPHATTKAQVGLGSVDNTSDMAKPVSTAQAAAIATAISNLVAGAPGALDTLNELAVQLGSDENAAGALTTLVSGIRGLSDSTFLTGLNNAIEGGQTTRRERLNRLLDFYTGSWFIRRVSTTDYRLLRSIGNGYYFSQRLEAAAGLPGGGNLVHQFTLSETVIPMLSLDEDDNFTFSGSWSRSVGGLTVGYKNKVMTGGAMTSGSAVLTVTGGDTFTANDVQRQIVVPGAGAAGADLVAFISSRQSNTQVTLNTTASTTVSGAGVTLYPEARQSSTATNTATWVSPTATALGLVVVSTTNGGLAKVTIDGSATAANALPTAQSKVDDGSYPSTILVANGGTLNPTDRVMDCYGTTTNWTDRRAIATGLSSATHTVVFTATGYTHTGGSGARAYVSGGSYATGTETPLTANSDLVTVTSLLASYSAYEYAYETVPTGGTTRTFIGSVHGYEIEDSFALTIDGAAVTLTDGETRAVGSFAEFTRATRLRHPDTSTTDQASILTVYRLDLRGITIRHTDTWLVAQTMYTAYPVMLPVSGLTFDRSLSDLGTTRSSWTGAGAITPGEKASSVVFWSATGKLATGVVVPAAQAIAFGWAATNLAYLDDRVYAAPDKINKWYISSVGGGGVTKAVAVGDVWQSEALYKFARFPAGANTVLATA